MTADTVGGVWTYALDLCRALQPYGIEVCMATMGAPLSPSQRAQAESISNLDIRESSYKLEWMENPWEDVEAAGEWLLDLEREVNPDLVHLNGYCHAALNWNARVVLAAHSCVLSWWQAVKGEVAPAEWKQYKSRVKNGLEAADAVIAISKSYADQLKYLYGYASKMPVVYNGRDCEGFYTSPKKKQAFAMGRVWDEAKNLSLLGKLNNESRLPILVAGDNHHPNTNIPLEIPHVQFLGILNPTQVKKHLAESYMYILPAKYEPFGLSVLEAALSGCLLLLADIPTLRELWQDSALYFNPDKPEELDEQINFALANPELCRLLVRRSSLRAKTFSLDTMAENYMNVYQSLVQTKEPLNKTVEI